MRLTGKKFGTVLLAFCLFILIANVSFNDPVSTVKAQQINPDEQKFFSEPLCLPDLYQADPGACIFSGPSDKIAEMVTLGFPYPIRDLPAATYDPSLSIIDANIARINLDAALPAQLFPSLDEAILEENPARSIPPGELRYVSYISRAQHEGKNYLQLTTGEWLRASPVAYNKFQGLEFFNNPINDFGWVVDETQSFTKPGFSSPATGKTYYRNELVKIYQVVEADSYYWYLIKPGEWLNSWKTRRVHYDPTPPEGITADRWISLNLYEQTLSIYENGNLKFATLMASGLDPFFTKPGLFQIYKKIPFETMTTGDLSDFYYLEDVPWTMYFDQSRAIHGSYWRTFFGYPQSHGCINLSPGDANWVYQWAEENDWVYVFDPSGKTPIDPDLYGPGAP